MSFERFVGEFFLMYEAKLIRNGYSPMEVTSAHQHANGARLGEERVFSQSREGTTIKIHIAADTHENPIDIEITRGQVHDPQVA